MAAFIWTYEAPTDAEREPHVLSTSAESIALAKDLIKRGWRFVGPTPVYVFMQAMGLVNDHVEGCAIPRKEPDKPEVGKGTPHQPTPGAASPRPAPRPSILLRPLDATSPRANFLNLALLAPPPSVVTPWRTIFRR